MDSNNMYSQNNMQGQDMGQGNQQYSSYYQTPIQPQGQMPTGQMPVGPELEEPVSLGEWLVSILLMCIPCVNIVLMFVWAFGGNVKKSKSNYFKATLIWTGIWTVLCFIMWIVMAIGIASSM